MRAHALVFAVSIACGGSSVSAPPEPAALGGTTVAVAGTVAIDITLVEGVARKTGVPPRAAAEELVFDAVLAQGATEKRLDRDPSVHQAERAILARVVADRLARDAAARGAPTDEEVAKITEQHWRDVDLPEQARAVHAVVMTKEKDAATLARARTVAEAVRRATVGAKDADDFIARAKTVDAAGFEIRPEKLPLFVADGRVVEGNGELDKDFTKGAFALAPGETSPVVATPFGFHVIRMLERLPGKTVPLEERRTRFVDEVSAMRAHDAYVALLADARRRRPVSIDPAADALMASASAP